MLHLSCSRRKLWYLLGSAVPRETPWVGKSSGPPSPLYPFSVPTLSQMEADPDVQSILGKLYLSDLGCSCKELLLSNYKAHDNQSAWPISAIKAIYVLRFCWWGLSTTICFNPSTPTFCSLDIQLFREIPLREHQSNSPFVSVPKYPATICAFLQNIPLSALHQKSSWKANKNQHFRFYCSALQLKLLYCKIRCHCEKHGYKYKSKRPFS